jgi:predicted metal-dependent HD superfamily phosphohydrolase
MGMGELLHRTFTSVASSYCHELSKIEQYWEEISNAYTGTNRFYHNLDHLHHLLGELESVRDKIDDWDVILFSIFYHDFIYDTLKSDNEEKSAIRAALRLTAIAFPKDRILQCVNTIHATKQHATNESQDINFFTDADLAVLGGSFASYQEYFKRIRKEYGWYPDLIYIPGRKKVLKHFLEIDRIYKTEHFFEKYEVQARQNVRQELDLLSGKPRN